MSLQELNTSLLVMRFNNRENLAFSQIYSILYQELHYFTNKIYYNSDVIASDVIQDIFVKLWLSKDLKFNDLINIKAYIYVSIKNGFKNYIAHKERKSRYEETIVNDDDLYVVEIIESEMYSFVNQAISVLPNDCAEIIKYHLEGWSPKEIAEKLNISERTVYNKKSEAVDILKRKFKKNTFLVILLLRITAN